MTATFNLVEEPWIPCATGSGVVELRGLFGALADARNYAGIRDPSPLVTVSLHRLLLAVLHRVFGPESPTAWAELWCGGKGRFDPARLDSYLRSSAIHPRFDLFGPEHPFYQTASLPLGPVVKRTDRPKYVKPAWQMAHELAYSDNLNMFSHYTENNWEVRPVDEVARWLVAFQGFALSGTITTEEGKKAADGVAYAGQLTKSAVVLARGDNLFETLMLNLVHYSADDEEPFRSRDDKPAWERDAETRPADRSYDGYLDLLTWQSRRVKIVPGYEGTGRLSGVSGVVAMKGYQLTGLRRYGRETMVGFVKREKATANQDPWPPLGFTPGKALWRDFHALLKSVVDKSERPRNLSWAAELGAADLIARKDVRLDIAGMCAERAKINFWRHETLPLPLAYLDRTELVESLREAIRLAERVGRAVVGATYKAVLQAKKDLATVPSGDATRALDFTAGNYRSPRRRPDPIGDRVKALAPDRDYWSRLDLRFRRFMEELADAADPNARSLALGLWFHADLAPLARRSYGTVVGALAGSQREHHGAAVGERYLARRLRWIGRRLPLPPRVEASHA